MPEHTPAPTPSRSVYGFVLYLSSTTAFVLYMVWAFIPDSVLHFCGLTYLPQKYWALAVPIFLCVGLALFAFLIYPGLNLMLTPALDDMRTITDSHAVNLKDKEAIHGGIPPVSDIFITDVCKNLYLKK